MNVIVELAISAESTKEGVELELVSESLGLFVEDEPHATMSRPELEAFGCVPSDREIG